MKRIQLASPGGLDNLQLVETERPSPTEDQILIKVGSSSLNYHDLLVAQGHIPTEDGRVVLSDCAATTATTLEHQPPNAKRSQYYFGLTENHASLIQIVSEGD